MRAFQHAAVYVSQVSCSPILLYFSVQLFQEAGVKEFSVQETADGKDSGEVSGSHGIEIEITDAGFEV